MISLSAADIANFDPDVSNDRMWPTYILWTLAQLVV